MKTKITFWKVVAAIIFVAGLYATFVRFASGLGASTNLTDQFPWGLWIGFDVLVGVGLAAGGFIIAATVHIFHLKKYEPISRPAILTAFLGYLLVVIGILFDLGRPYRVWHPLIMWNPHSVMFEVGWCVTLYTIVLGLEFSPLILEKFNMKLPLKLIRTIYLPVVIAGVLLSTLHQSSLGTLFVIVPDKLHALWYSPFLPVFFFITAIVAGLGMTIIESFLSYRAFGKRLEKDLLMGIARVIVVVLAVYFVFKMQDLYRRGNLSLIFDFNRQSVLFWGEMGLGVLLPMVLLFIERVRRSEAGLFLSSLLVVVGFIVSRLNVSITGMANSNTYFPKWTEVAVSVALIALGFTVFALAVKHLNVFLEPGHRGNNKMLTGNDRHPVFSGNVMLIMWAVVIAGFMTYGLSENFKAAPGEPQTETVERSAEPAGDLSLPEDITFPLGEDSPGPVTFSHERHVAMQEQPSCASCHTSDFKILGPASLQKDAAMEPMYEGGSCAVCHNGDKAFAVDECMSCHVEE